MRTQATRPFGHAMLRVCVSTPRSEDGAAQQPRKPLPPPAPSASPRPGDRRPAAPHAAWSSPECRLDERGLWNGPVEMIRHLRERHREGRREEGGGTGGGRREERRGREEGREEGGGTEEGALPQRHALGRCQAVAVPANCPFDRWVASPHEEIASCVYLLAHWRPVALLQVHVFCQISSDFFFLHCTSPSGTRMTRTLDLLLSPHWSMKLCSLFLLLFKSHLFLLRYSSHNIKAHI